MSAPPTTDDTVLSTLNKDGSRNWIHPKLSKGSFYRWRQVVGYGLVALFAAFPYISINGKPAILLDLPARQFTFFGKTFFATDTLPLMPLGIGIVITVFFLTALFGRVWCGWACPQTVYMELLYRPIERFFEGSPSKQRKIDRQGMSLKRLAKIGVFLLISMFVAHVFLAYFVGVERLARWVQSSPAQHPAAFLIMTSVTALMFFDFAYFREQTCIIACPYGRLQSVLFDKQTMIVGYDDRRGEPRGKLKHASNAEGATLGDCIDCNACVVTCPTGIDIRQGLQMECIGCTQCIDACDAIMDRIDRPRGLIRYTSQDDLAGKPTRRLRPRVVIYPTIMAIVFGLFGLAISGVEETHITVLREQGSPYSVLPDGQIANRLRIKVTNRTAKDQSYQIEYDAIAGLSMIAPRNPLPIKVNKTEVAPLILISAPSFFKDGKADVAILIRDNDGNTQKKAYRLIGPIARQDSAQ